METDESAQDAAPNVVDSSKASPPKEEPGENDAPCITYKGKVYLYAPKSLGFIGTEWKVRQYALDIVHHNAFDNVILGFIALNSLLIAMIDWDNIDLDPESDTYRLPIADGSWENTIIEGMELVFMIVFTIEMVLKILALGFTGSKDAYIKSPWNKLDFVVVMTSLPWTEFIPNMPNVSILRTFRILRPLRTLNAIPELQNIVRTILVSLPDLGNVILILCFIFALFGILGMQLFSGRQHFRCRLTPFPVTIDWSTASDPYDYAKYACLLGSEDGLSVLSDEDQTTTSVARLAKYNFNILQTGETARNDKGDWEKADSPWSQPLECYWPFDSDDQERICDPTESGYPQYQCYHDTTRLDYTDWRWCGSNYDARGNERFKGPVTISGVKYTTEHLMALPTYNELLSYGYMNFDNFASAFLTVFQCITMEGWVYISYQLMDGWSATGAAIFFSVLIIFGSFFVINLLLAVMESNFHMEDDEEEETPIAIMPPPSGNAGSEEAAEVHADAAEKEAPPTSEARDPDFADQEPTGMMGNLIAKWWTSPRRKFWLDIVSHGRFQGFITSLIILNTITLSMDHHPMDPGLQVVLEAINFVLTLCFAVEMFLKLYAMGFWKYQEDTFNRFDGFIVVVSLIELAIFPPSFKPTTEEGGGLGGAILGLRSFRLFRIFKLAREWVSMRKLLVKIAITCVDIGYFGILLLLFMFIASLIGCQFFANRLHFDENGYVVQMADTDEYHDAYIPRSNFDGLVLSFTTVFQILSCEGWNLVMYDARRATTWVSSFYFVILMITGGFIFMNLFVAILLGNFCNDDDDDEEEEEVVAGPPSGDGKVAPVMDGLDDDNREADDEELEMAPPLTLAVAPDVKGSVQPEVDGSAVNRTPDASDDENETTTSEATTATPTDPSGDEVFPLQPGKILFLFDENNAFRLFCARVVAHPWFDQTILILIIISSLFLALDDPLKDPESTLAAFLHVSDIIMTILFTFEMLFKIFAIGFAFHPRSYLQNNWNRLDFVVVCISVVTLIGVEGLKALRTLRALRALRPLRVVKRAPGLRIVVNAMFSAIPDVLNVMAVCSLFFLIFSILGVTFFKGQLRACEGDAFDNLDNDVVSFLEEPKAWKKMDSAEKAWFLSGSSVTDDFDSCTNLDSACCSEWPNKDNLPPTSKQVCQCLGLKWDKVVPQTFDNAARAFLTFFEISTTEGWAEVMYAAVDTSGIDMQPIRDNSLHWVWFFMLFILIGGYLVLNLFVGVVVDNFNSVRKNAEGDVSLLTEEQQAWIKTQQTAAKMKPKIKLFPPRNKFGKWAFEWVANDQTKKQQFEVFIMSCIVLNTIVMAMTFFGMDLEYETALEMINYAFAIIFTVEAVIKLAGLQWNYFDDNWNRFDFAIVCGTNIGIVLLFAANVGLGSVTTLVRTFRVGRILRLIQGAKSLRRLFNTLILTLPGLSNISCLLFLLLFIFTVMGTSLFATVGFHRDHNENANFRSFWHAVLTLIRFSTGENWNGMMHSLYNPHDMDCDPEPEYNKNMCGFNNVAGCEPMNGCGTWLAFPYMILFNIVVAFVFINLFIGVILEGFDLANEDFGVSEEDFQRFSEHWSEFDHKATCYMPEGDVGKFVATLAKPFGVGLKYQLVDYGYIHVKEDAQKPTPALLGAWEEKFKELEAHKDVHGNCNVNQNNAGNQELLKWVEVQRKEWKKFQHGPSKSLLSQEQIEKLSAIAFTWEGVVILEEGEQERSRAILDKVEDLGLKSDKHGNVHFKDVLTGLANQIVREQVKQVGKDADDLLAVDKPIGGRAAKGLKEMQKSFSRRGSKEDISGDSRRGSKEKNEATPSGRRSSKSDIEEGVGAATESTAMAATSEAP